MKDKDNTNEQLINELIKLCQRIAETEASETKRKQAEKGLRRVQEHFSKIYNSSMNAVGYAILEKVLPDANDSFLKLTSYSREELLNGKTYQDITPEEYHE